MKGKVKFFNERKGFGFIAGEDGKDYFMHQSALAAGVMPKENDAVVFDVEEGDRGLKAANVSIDKGGASDEAASDDEETTE
jgi:CspA family cold shock protein